jgi:hypothetical protein
MSLIGHEMDMPVWFVEVRYSRLDRPRAVVVIAASPQKSKGRSTHLTKDCLGVSQLLRRI